ncbi:NAD+ synthase [Pseudobacter ginsenosidimutans]|uniref:Glutamine-dependent NAD(+) synthetase n=1 Tax=Pseudobacter ginsenosidimutans TaxID=661488 RepID=A0A4Q7MTM0_9BACT|nr:NAD+ synthase [Pseudobacter ginsenosidimutans]QEC41904.1 NAD+ synthase [Pseudobacter ginsenosidimutans]RZS71269.1 NH(3)-dependent NAD(+) synthetase [Pseudobacter ginsenosidimutans]
MKIALAQQNYHIGNFEDNTRKIIGAIQYAKSRGADLVVFSELSVCGYPPRDLLEFNDFVNECYKAIDIIKEHTDTIGVIIGAPQRNPEKEGKDLFNAAWFLYEKQVLGVAQKTCLPTYDVFDENRYFEPAYHWEVVRFKGKRIALTICEDIWNLGDNPLYRINPMDKLIVQHPDLMINISASPFDYDHDDDRLEVIRANVLKYKLPMFYCNTIGSQTEVVFDGGSLVMDAQGRVIKAMKVFEEDFAIVDTDQEQSTVTTKAPAPLKRATTAFDKEMRVSKVDDPDKIIDYLTSEKNIGEIHQALILGIRDYFRKMGFSKAILGSSGGIDSAVALALACEALGKDNVRAILMPSEFSSDHSVSDAEQLSRNLGNPCDIIPIKDIYNQFLTTLEPVFKGLPFGLAEENIQSRTRGNLLMAIANKFGYILLNTSNKSELATGYGTLYGDMAGGLSVLGDVYKMQVYALAEYINRNGVIIPENIIHKAPSAELRPDQKDSDSLPEYPVLDKVLYQYIERRQGPKEIIEMGIDEALVRRILKLVNTAEYKRNQFCPIIRVSSKAFGVGRRVPIVGKYLS